MTKSFKKQWIKALKSGDYKQGKESLYNKKDIIFDQIADYIKENL